MRAFFEDLRFGLRLLQSNPGFTVVTVLTLALGIAAGTTVFSWLDSLVLNPIHGAADGRRLAMLEGVSASGNIQVSYLDYRDYRDNLKLISGLAAARQDVCILGEPGNAQPVWGELVSTNYFDVLGVKPMLGRTFGPEESGDKPGAFPLVVISERLWRNTYRSDPNLIGKTIRVNRHSLTVIGVVPANFYGTQPGILYDLWTPITMGAELGMFDGGTFRWRGTRNLSVLARLQPGVSVEQARSEAEALGNRLAAMYPNFNKGLTATLLPIGEAHMGAPELLAGPLRVLMAVCGVVFLIVCANVSNLLLARAIARQREFGIRIALGSGRTRLVRQLLTESLLMAAAGSIAGLLLSLWMADGLPWLIPRIGIRIAVGLDLNFRVLVFTTLACGLAALLAGAAPALFSLRSDVNETLKQGGRTGTAGVGSHRVRGLLVVSEVALAALALVGAGLFLRSFQNARNVYPGFDKQHVLMTRFYIATGGYSEAELQQFSLRLRERLGSAPGILRVAYGDSVPLGSTAGPWHDVQVEGYVPAAGEDMKVSRSLVSPGYLDTLKIPILQGRDFNDADDANSLRVAIVNETFVKRYMGGLDPIGRKVRGWGKWMTVVGVARDSRYFSPVERARPYFYAPFRQMYSGGLSIFFLMRTAGEPENATGLLRREVMLVDPNAGAYQSMPLADYDEVTMLPHKVAASLLSVLGLISLILAGVGLYSVMAYAVTQKTQEIGIRMALGARPGDVIGSVLKQGMGWTLAGLAAGALLAFISTRIVGSMLVNVSAADPVAFLGAAVFLSAVALLATYLPARRATRVDPIIALRCE